MAYEREFENQLQEDTQKGKYLTFSLDKEVYGIEIKYVTEIVSIQPITPIPEVPRYIKGIINLRGKIIAVVDMRLKFNKEPAAYDDRTCIVVVDIGGIPIGLIVDQVAEVINIAEENISLPSGFIIGSNNHFIKEIGKVGSAVILLLACEQLLDPVVAGNLAAIA